MNKIFLIGNLTRDPELRTTNSGTSVCNFDIAVNNYRRNNNQQQDQSSKDGNKDAMFFRIAVWRELGVICSKYLKKGRKVMVEGSLNPIRTYTASDGTTRAQAEVTATHVEFLSGVNASTDPDNAVQSPAPEAAATQQPSFTEVESDDLPF